MNDLTKEEILNHLKLDEQLDERLKEKLEEQKIQRFQVQVFDTIESTHLYAKELVNNQPDFTGVIIANEQTAGIGRYGKPFHSPGPDEKNKARGIYMNFVLPNFPVAMTHVTMYVAVCYVRAIQKTTGRSADIKWVNDLFLNGYKFVGILTEILHVKGDPVTVVGVGLNFYHEQAQIPQELKGVMTALYVDTPPPITRSQLVAALINEVMTKRHMTETAILQAYKDHLFVLGQQVVLVNGEVKQTVTAIDLDDMGYLIVEDETGQKRTLVAGEVSVRPI